MDSGARSGGRGTGDGQVLILFALFALVLVGVLALAVDVGYLLTERREAQSAADAAALAGAAALLGGEDHATAQAVSRAYAQENGVILGTDTVNVAVDGDSFNGLVTVDLESPVERFFIGAIYSGSWEVSAHAVAEVTGITDARYALVSLDPPGMYVGGGAQLTVLDGGIISNGNISASGDSNIVTSDGFIDAVGSINENESWLSPAEYGIRERRGPSKDPFEAVAPPTAPTSPVYTTDINCPSTCSMTPGYYDNVKINIGGEMMLASGLYYFNNSSITLGNSSARIYGDKVTLYFDGLASKAYFDPKNGRVNLTAPNHPYPGNNDYGDMAIWINNCSTFDAQGSNEFFIGGVFYAPCSAITLHGNPSGEAVSGMVVSSTLDIRGSVDFTIAYIPYGPTESFEVYLRE